MKLNSKIRFVVFLIILVGITLLLCSCGTKDVLDPTQETSIDEFVQELSKAKTQTEAEVIASNLFGTNVNRAPSEFLNPDSIQVIIQSLVNCWKELTEGTKNLKELRSNGKILEVEYSKKLSELTLAFKEHVYACFFTQYSIKGQVKDFETNVGIPNAQVQVKFKGTIPIPYTYTKTDAKGSYIVERLPYGTFDIIFLKKEYISASTKVNVDKSNVSVKTISLIPLVPTKGYDDIVVPEVQMWEITPAQIIPGELDASGPQHFVDLVNQAVEEGQAPDELESIYKTVEEKLSQPQIDLLLESDPDEMLQSIEKTGNAPTWLNEIIEVFQEDAVLSSLLPRMSPPKFIAPDIISIDNAGFEGDVIGYNAAPTASQDDAKDKAKNKYDEKRREIEKEINEQFKDINDKFKIDKGSFVKFYNEYKIALDEWKAEAKEMVKDCTVLVGVGAAISAIPPPVAVTIGAFYYLGGNALINYRYGKEIDFSEELLKSAIETLEKKRDKSLNELNDVFETKINDAMKEYQSESARIEAEQHPPEYTFIDDNWWCDQGGFAAPSRSALGRDDD